MDTLSIVKIKQMERYTCYDVVSSNSIENCEELIGLMFRRLGVIEHNRNISAITRSTGPSIPSGETISIWCSPPKIGKRRRCS